MICSNAIRTGANNYTLPMPGGNLKQIKRMDTIQKVEIYEGNDRFNDISRIASLTSIGGLRHGAGELNLSMLISNKNTNSCFRGAIENKNDVDYYTVDTMTQYFAGKPVSVDMETEPGSALRITIYDQDGNQAGYAVSDENGKCRVEIPCDKLTSIHYTIKIEGLSENVNVPYKLSFSEGEMSAERKADLVRARARGPVKSVTDPEEIRASSERLKAELKEKNTKGLAEIKNKQVNSLPDNVKYKGKESLAELLNKKSSGKKLTPQEEEYIQIYGSLDEMEDVHQNILLADIQKRLNADLDRIGIDTSKDISIKTDCKKDVTVTGLTEEENMKVANLIKEKYSDWLYNSYLHNSENVKAMNDGEYQIAQFADELQRDIGAILSKQGISFDIDKVSMLTTGNGIFAVTNIEGIPESLKSQINSADEGTKLADMGKMLFAICDYKRINGSIPRFNVSMDISDGRIMFQ